MTEADQGELAGALAENEELRGRLSEATAHVQRLTGDLSRGEAEYASLARDAAEMRQALHGSETRYRLIVQSIVDYAIVVSDLSGRVTVWNDAAEAVLGWRAEEMTGQPLSLIFTPEDREAGVPEREMGLALEDGKARDERWHLAKGGRRFYAIGELMPLRDDADRPIGFLKILRDRTREEDARRELEINRERLQFALDASALVGTWDWDVVADRVYADSRFASLFGLDPEPAAKGLPMGDYLGGIFAEDREEARARIDEAMASGADYAHEYRTINRDGKVRWVYARGRCFADASGRPARFPGAVVDITLEKLREARQAALLRLGDDMGPFGEPVDFTLKALQILGEALGVERVGYASVDEREAHVTIVGEWTRPGAVKLSGRLAIAGFGDKLAAAMREGLVVVPDVASDARTADGIEAWDAIGAKSMVNVTVIEDGVLKVILYLHAATPREWSNEEISFIRDVLGRAWTFSQRRRAEQALIETETRLRLAQEAAEIGTFDYDLKTGELLWDKRCRVAFGLFSDEPVTYQGHFVAGLHPEDRARTLTAVEQTLGPGSDGVLDVVYRTIGRDDGTVRTIQASGQTVVDGGQAVRLVGAVRDVTEEKEAENRQILLTRELQHRVKNTLAMVNALANQTLRRAANAQEGLAAFSARLIALSHAHDILTQTSWTSAPVQAIVAQSLTSHEAGGRIVWSGPDVRLTAKQSLALALALHELATNAVKYGALSNDEGRILIAWRISMADDAPELHFEWREEGGPPVEAPASRGFGSRLIEQALSLEFGGTVEMRYEPQGLVCTIDAKLQLDLEEDVMLPLKLDDGAVARG